MEKTKVTCKEVMDHICDNLGEELSSPKCLEIKRHLEGCSDCRNYFKSVETTISFYKQYNVELSEDAHERLIGFLGLKE
ncbi:MAG: zf-HC2 domain-containing protein [Ignavibacteriales bacterium]